MLGSLSFVEQYVSALLFEESLRDFRETNRQYEMTIPLVSSCSGEPRRLEGTLGGRSFSRAAEVVTSLPLQAF